MVMGKYRNVIFVTATLYLIANAFSRLIYKGIS